jgi:hypothetical protein
MTKEELEGVFKSYGALKDVRIVTYRNGHSKGLAYVEFHDEVCSFIDFLFSFLFFPKCYLTMYNIAY